MYEPKEFRSGKFNLSAWVTEVDKSGVDLAAIALI